MKKDILKEIIIVLLLILTVILVLGVLLYDYVPNNKIIPEPVAYTRSEKVSKELEEQQQTQDIDNIPNLSYEVTESQLDNYEKIQEYVSGRKNPFASLEEKTKNQDGEESNTISTSPEASSSNSSTTTSTQTNDDDGYLPKTGTK